MFTSLFACKQKEELKLEEKEELRLYLVRHAEKQTTGADPDLTTIGMARADSLSRLLKDADVCEIFSSNYKRTRNTAQPLATLLSKSINIYTPFDADFTKYLKDSLSCPALVVGHSNTIPGLVNDLIGEIKYQDLADSEYDKLFILIKTDSAFTSQVISF